MNGQGPLPDIVEALARRLVVVCALIDECPAGREAGREQAIALWAKIEAERGAVAGFDLPTMLDLIDRHLEP